MSDSELDKMLTAASVGMAMSAAAKAKGDQQALAAIETTELDSMGRIIAKKEQFRAAALDMVTDITARTSSHLTDDLADITVRKDWSLSKSPVPAAIKMRVCDSAQNILNQEIKTLLTMAAKDAEYVVRQGLRDYDHDEEKFVRYFELGRGSEFIADLNDTEVAAIAKTGVINIVENHLQDILKENKTPGDVIGAKPKEMTGQEYRALEAAFVHATQKVVTICVNMKREPQAIVMANLPVMP